LSFVKEEADLNQPVNMTHARAVFEGLNLAETLVEGGEKRTWDEVVSTESESSVTTITKAREYARRLDIDLESSSGGHAFINGRHYDVNDVRARRSVAGFSLTTWRSTAISWRASDGHQQIYAVLPGAGEI
jgi:hypothetical protein